MPSFPVGEMNPDGGMGLSSRHIKVSDEAFFFKNLGHGQLQLRVWEDDRIVSHLYSITNPGQHVCQRISYRHFWSISRLRLKLKGLRISSSNLIWNTRLKASLPHAGQFTVQGHLPEADATEAGVPVVGTRPVAAVAPVIFPAREFRLFKPSLDC